MASVALGAVGSYLASRGASWALSYIASEAVPAVSEYLQNTINNFASSKFGNTAGSRDNRNINTYKKKYYKKRY